jgi:hypothetical protein
MSTDREIDGRNLLAIEQISEGNGRHRRLTIAPATGIGAAARREVPVVADEEVVHLAARLSGEVVEEAGGGSFPGVRLGVVGDGIHRNSVPTEVLFQIVGRAVPDGIAGPDVEESAAAAVGKKGTDERLFVVL